MGAALPALAGVETTFDVPANVAFALAAATMIIAAIRVVTTRNVVHAALWLVVVLGGNAILYLLLQAEFVAVTQVLVYLGAVVVLFLFGIMLTRAPMGRSGDLDNDQRPIGAVIGVVLFAVMAWALVRTWGDDQLTFVAFAGEEVAGGNGRTQALAQGLFGDYLVPFEMTSVLLLAALIGAIVLARRD
jgi:NADH-quinone oxidoreductase subunit J